MAIEHIYAADLLKDYASEILYAPDLNSTQVAFLSAAYNKFCKRIAEDAGLNWSKLEIPVENALPLRICATNPQTEADVKEAKKFLNLTYGCKDCGGIASNPTAQAFDARRCNKCQQERDEDMASRLRQEHQEKKPGRLYDEHSTHHPTDGKA